MNKVFEVIETKNIFNISYNKIGILVHPKSYIHAIVKFKNGITKILLHDTSMKIPVFNTLYYGLHKKINSKLLDLDKLNNLNLKPVDLKKFTTIKILNNLPQISSLYETILVVANDEFVNLFLKKKINFNQISHKLLSFIKIREFQKYKRQKPKNIHEIVELSKYVRLKLNTLSI